MTGQWTTMSENLYPENKKIVYFNGLTIPSLSVGSIRTTMLNFLLFLERHKLFLWEYFYQLTPSHGTVLYI